MTWSRVQRNYSPRTIENYSLALRQFQEYVDESEFSTLTLAELTLNHLRPFLGWLHEKGMSNVTIRLKVSAVKSFFRFLKNSDILESNQSSTLKRPKAPKLLPSFLTESEASNLFAAIEKDDSISSRDRTLFELLYGSGLRISEVLTLKRKDIDLVNERVRVMGKGRKQRIVPLSRPACNAMSQLITARAGDEKSLSPEIDLFVGERGNRLNASVAWRIINRILGPHTRSKKKSAHVLRHSFATHLLNNGAEIQAVGELLGHASLSTTQKYTHVSIEHLRKAYKLAHPKA